MFQYAEAFNGGNLSGWKVSGVTNMAYMFYAARVFKGQVLGWDVSQVTNMAYMFSYAQVFNGDVLGWDVSNNVDMSYMFYLASAFNQNLCSWARTFSYNKAVGIFALSNCTFTVGPVSEKCGLFVHLNAVLGQIHVL